MQVEWCFRKEMRERHFALFQTQYACRNSSITSHAAKILPTWKYCLHPLEHALQLFFGKERTLWVILSTTGQFLEFVSQLDQPILTHFSMVLILRTSSLSLRLEILRNEETLGGKGRERRCLSRFMKGIFRDFRRMANGYRKLDWSCQKP